QKQWGIEPRGYGSGRRRLGELRRMAVERGPLAIVELRDVHHERRRRRIVDEVVADPVDLPGLALWLVPPQPRRETGLRQQVARGHVIGMPIHPVRRRDDARTMVT